MIMKLKLAVLAVMTAFFISGCVPSPTSVALNVSASADANGGLPVKATVFYLASTDKFKTADYFALAGNAQAVLGADLLKTDTVLLSPGQSKSVSASFDAGGPTAVGVMVGYQAIDSAKWNASIGVKPEAANLLTVSVGAGSVSISK